jgi:hypothetical protein
MTNGNWIQTYTGKQFYFDNFDPDDIDIKDIAHSLSLLSRFNGHCLKFYSVAEHCVRVSEYMEEAYYQKWDIPEKDHERCELLWGLLHDAAEAYTSDIPRPLKHQDMMYDFRKKEKEIENIIYEKYIGFRTENIDRMRLFDRAAIADATLLVTEQRDLMHKNAPDWEIGIEPLEDVHIIPYGPEDAERMFLDRFHQLRKVMWA